MSIFLIICLISLISDNADDDVDKAADDDDGDNNEDNNNRSKEDMEANSSSNKRCRNVLSATTTATWAGRTSLFPSHLTAS